MRIEPTLEVFFHRGPFAVEQGKPGRIAVAAFDDYGLAEGAFISEAEAEGGSARGLVQRVAFPFEAAVAQFVEYARHQQEDGFGGGWGLLEGWAEVDVADFDDAVSRVDAHQAGEACGFARFGVDNGVEQRVGFGGHAGKPTGKGRKVRKGTIGQISPCSSRSADEDFGEALAMAVRVEPFQATGTALKRLR